MIFVAELKFKLVIDLALSKQTQQSLFKGIFRSTPLCYQNTLHKAFGPSQSTNIVRIPHPVDKHILAKSTLFSPNIVNNMAFSGVFKSSFCGTVFINTFRIFTFTFITVVNGPHQFHV